MSQKTKKQIMIKQIIHQIKSRTEAPEIDYRIADLNQAIREIKFNYNNNISIKARRLA